MKFSAFLASLKARLLTASDEQKPMIEAQIRELESVEPDTAPAPVLTDVQTSAVPKPDSGAALSRTDIRAIIKEELNTVAKDLVGELKKEISAPLQRQEHDKKVAGVLDEAVAKGRIVAEKRADWKKRLDDSFDTVAPILGELPEGKAVNNPQSSVKSTDGNQSQEKKYDNKFARSLDPTVMKYVEESIASA